MHTPRFKSENFLLAAFHWAAYDDVILLLTDIYRCIDDIHVLQISEKRAQVISGALLQALENDGNVSIVDNVQLSMKIIDIQIFNRGTDNQRIDQAGRSLRYQRVVQPL